MSIETTTPTPEPETIRSTPMADIVTLADLDALEDMVEGTAGQPESYGLVEDLEPVTNDYDFDD